jgi:hypothetical protein
MYSQFVSCTGSYYSSTNYCHCGDTSIFYPFAISLIYYFLAILHYSAAITYWQTHDNLALFLEICRFRHLLRHQGGVEFLVFHLYAQTSLCICYIDEKVLLHSQILLFVGGWFRDLNACLLLLLVQRSTRAAQPV